MQIPRSKVDYWNDKLPFIKHFCDIGKKVQQQYWNSHEEKYSNSYDILEADVHVPMKHVLKLVKMSMKTDYIYFFKIEHFSNKEVFSFNSFYKIRAFSQNEKTLIRWKESKISQSESVS